MIAYFVGGYFALNRINSSRAWYVDPSVWFDAAVPFVPEAIFAYALVYTNVIIGYVSIPLRELRSYRRAIVWLALCVTIGFACFALLPVRALHRPEVVPDGTIARSVTAFYFWLDAPNNLMPSMHVALALLSGLLCRRAGPVRGAIGMVSAALVAISVVLVKQHYVADVVAAIVLVAVTARALRIDLRSKTWPN